MTSKYVICGFIFGALVFAGAENAVQIIHSQWGDIKHRPNALARAMREHEMAEIKAFPEIGGEAALAGEGTFQQRLQNRLAAAQVTAKLPEIVRVEIEHTAGGKQCKIVAPNDCIENPVTVVIALYDVDGNRSSIWTGANDLTQPLPVTGVEPY